jgi:FimV-like protein
MKYKILAVTTGLLLAVSVLLQTVIAAGAYGPTKENETLWDIASRLRPSANVTVQQMMLALREKNPEAFNANNINTLQKNVYLTLPTQAEINHYSKATALHRTWHENRQWQSGRVKPWTRTDARNTQIRLKAEINELRAQLKQEQHHSSELSARIRKLQATTKVPESAVTAPTGISSTSTQSAQPEEVKKLQAEVASLKSQLEEKDTHIQNLQASLREASISIKRQYEESQNLHPQLQAVKPDSHVAAPVPPPEPGTGSQPSLSLEGTPEKALEPTQAASPDLAAPPAFTDQVSGKVSAPVAATPEPVTEAVPLKQVLEQQTSGKKEGNPASKLVTPSHLSMAVALISLLFILALLWRSFSQQRMLNKEEERLRASLDQYDALAGRKEPEILPDSP